jgi:hypothetical protein
VVANTADYDVFEQMHYVCLHYELKHRGDPDLECDAGGCPAPVDIHHASCFLRTEGVDLMYAAANTLVLAILELESRGCTVIHNGALVVATTSNARFPRRIPSRYWALIRLAELRRPWRATDAEIDGTLDCFDL